MFVIPDEIVTLRRRLSMGQSQFAALMGVHPMTVSRWERGVVAPTPYQSAFLAEFKRAAKSEKVRKSALAAMVGAGVVGAVYLLLKASRKGE